MFSSLRSRLWLSYALVIVSALFLTVIWLALYLVRSPLAYRATLVQMEEARETLAAHQAELLSLPAGEIENALAGWDQVLGMRLVLLNGRRVEFDSRSGVEPSIVPPRRLQILLPAFSLRDSSGRVWLYVLDTLPDGRKLLFLTPRPRLPLLGILRNELFQPFLYAGTLALILSLFLAFGLARWIGNPLQKLAAASRQMPAAHALLPDGPSEVQELTRAFNEMSTRLNGAQKAQRDFVANVSHELKTPITSIQGFAQALQDGTADNEEARRKAAGFIQVEAGRMHRMVLDLLDLARIDSGTLNLEKSPVDLSFLLRSLVEKFSLQAQAAGLTIHLQADSIPAILGDGDRLAQVFSNLVDNALKFTPAGGSIIISSHLDGSSVQVEVADSGMGIAAEALPRIFDRFYQADVSRPGGRTHGAGLGLSIVKEIINAHGGKISVHSLPGKGTTFTVTLPLVPPDASTVVSKRKK